MIGPNALPPDMMTPAERRAELCRLLALGLVRIHLRVSDQLSAKAGEFSLHNPPDQSAHATPTQKETA
ncbi:hypothetical protein DYI42_06865 [Vannielia litorea]|nr:hypothetical protein [Vannielia litorea]